MLSVIIVALAVRFRCWDTAIFSNLDAWKKNQRLRRRDLNPGFERS